jgi:hypothetical protein
MIEVSVTELIRKLNNARHVLSLKGCAPECAESDTVRLMVDGGLIIMVVRDNGEVRWAETARVRAKR